MRKLFIFLLLGMFMLSFASAALTDGLVSYYKLDETSGTTAVDSVNVNNGTITGVVLGATGKINTAYDFLGTSINKNVVLGTAVPDTNRVFSFWLNATATTGMIYSTEGVSNYYSKISIGSTGGGTCSAGKICFGRFISSSWGNVQSTNSVTANTWEHWIVSVNETNITIWKNGVLDSSQTIGKTSTTPTSSTIGNLAWGESAGDNANAIIDEIGIWNRSLTASEITELYNSGTGLSYPFSGLQTTINITLNSPLNNSQLDTDGTNFTASFNLTSNPNNYTWKNATYYVWQQNGTFFNSTTVSLSGNDTNYSQFIDDFTLGTYYKWNVLAWYGNASYNNYTWATNNFSFYNTPFTIDSVNYDLSVLETDYKNFNLTINTNPEVSSLVSYFWYDGTRYTQSLTNGVGGVYTASKSIDIPLQQSSGNKSFLWEFDITLNDGRILMQNTSTYSQQVNRTYLVVCNATYNTTFINFSAYSATNPFPLASSVTFKSAWTHYVSTGTGNVYRNYTYEDVTATKNNWTFCGSPNVTFQTNTEIEYDGADYALNFYYLTNASLSNSTQYIKLYLLNNSLATATILKIQDTGQRPKEGYTILTQFYDVGTGAFYLVSMAKTDYKGEDVLYLNWYDTSYKFIILDADGNIVKTTTTTKITSTPTTIEILDEITLGYEKFKDFVYNLYFDNSTNNFVLTYTKPSGLVDEACLRVFKQDGRENTLICNKCETSASATVYCNIGSYGNGTFIGLFYATGSFDLVDWIYKNIGGTFQETIYNLLGNEDASFYAFLFAGLVTLALFINAVFGIIALMIGLIGASALGFTAIQWGEMMGIICLGGLIIWLIKR